MTKKVYNAFFIWNIEKEEKWLNSMAEKGWCLVSVKMCKYTFQKCQPGEFAIRIDYLDKKVDDKKSKDYIDFVVDTGVILITARGKIVYFRKKCSDGDFELFSDNPSRISYYKRINKQMKFVGVLTGYLIIKYFANCFYMPEEFRVINITMFIITLVFGMVLTVGLIKNNKKIKKLENNY